MLIQSQPHAAVRELRTLELSADLVVVGGGLAGTCCAITAARHGIKVILVQDRPVLGGNASSEVRLWCLGATAYMSNNNLWSREGGVINEILLENRHRNPEGNPVLFDLVLLEKAREEPNLTLLLNTAAFQVEKSDADTLSAAHAFCSQNSTRYVLRAPLFTDASGDGIVGFLGGAAFRMGAEDKAEFGEGFAPDEKAYGALLGDSIYFYSKDAGHPVEFVAPSFALKDITQIPRHRQIGAGQNGCQFWWIEFGGRLDTVHAAEEIKWELWKVVYGIWDYIKNSAKFPEAANLTLEWVGTIPGKREARRFEGPYMLRQADVVKNAWFDDAVSYGGWACDLHPADGIYAKGRAYNDWHMRGVYRIPYRCHFSRNIRNLFFAGRTISATHVAFSTTRVMATCAHGGQAVALAAALCRTEGCLPADLMEPARLKRLQRGLLRTGHHIPGFALEDEADLARSAHLSASSTLALAAFPPDGPWHDLNVPAGQWIALPAGPAPRVTFHLDAPAAAELVVTLRTSRGEPNFTPDLVLAERRFTVRAGEQALTVDFACSIPETRYHFIHFARLPGVQIRQSEFRCTGVLAAFQKFNLAQNEPDIQRPPAGLGFEELEFYIGRRRPGGQNLALAFDPPVRCFDVTHLVNGVQRPLRHANAWVADPADPAPSVTLRWETPRTLARVEVFFDADYDNALESVLAQSRERVAPFCVSSFRLLDDQGAEIVAVGKNHRDRRVLVLAQSVTTSALTVSCGLTHGGCPASIFEVRAYAEANPAL